MGLWSQGVDRRESLPTRFSIFDYLSGVGSPGQVGFPAPGEAGQERPNKTLGVDASESDIVGAAISTHIQTKRKQLFFLVTCRF
jgi:hypothetical protein